MEICPNVLKVFNIPGGVENAKGEGNSGFRGWNLILHSKLIKSLSSLFLMSHLYKLIFNVKCTDVN